MSTRITTIHFVLRILSAEFQPSRSEARHWRILYKSPHLETHLQNLPSSVTKILLYKTDKATIEGRNYPIENISCYT